MVALLSKSSIVVARAFDQAWLCRYPRHLEYVHDAGSEFTGIEFQELLQSYTIKARPFTVNNPQANSILERAHQTITNQMRSIILMSVNINSVADMQHYIIDPVKWALNSTITQSFKQAQDNLPFVKT
jgi:transposase InsO family protein